MDRYGFRESSLRVAPSLGQDGGSDYYMPGVDFTAYEPYSGVVSVPAEFAPNYDDSSFWDQAQVQAGEIPDPNVTTIPWNQYASSNPAEIPWGEYASANTPKTAPAPTGGGGGGGDVGGLVGALAKGLKNLFHHGSSSPPPRALPGVSGFPFNTQTLVVVGLVGALAVIALRRRR